MGAPVRFLQGHIAWKKIQKAVRSGPAQIAVAWWGKGMSKVLPLKKGSVLVVRADRATMEQGQTSPHDLEVLVKRGVRVHSLSGLHAKVFAFDSVAFIGSTNASQLSWSGALIEAAVEVNYSRAVSAARKQVSDWAVDQPLDLEAIAELKKLYQPPKWPEGVPRPRKTISRTPRRAEMTFPLVRIVRTESTEWSDHTQDTYDQRAPAVRKEAARDGEELQAIQWKGVFSGDEEARYLQIFDDGNVSWVHAPARLRRFLSTKRGQPERLLLLSERKGVRRKRLTKVTKALGPGSALSKRLRGKATVIKVRKDIERLLGLWAGL